jgi:signal transduction histidine kinase
MTSDGIFSSSILEELETSSAAAWLWDVDRCRIAWANKPGAALWGETSILDLIDRPFAKSDAVARSLESAATALRRDAPSGDDGNSAQHKHEQKQLIIFPIDRAVELNAQISHHRLPDGRLGLLIKSIESQVPMEDGAASAARQLALIRGLPAAAALYGMDGRLIVQSAQAESDLGPNGTLGERLGDDSKAVTLIASTLSSDLVSKRFDVSTPIGPRLARVTAQRIRDPKSGYALIVAIFNDITDRAAFEKSLEARAAAPGAKHAKLDLSAVPIAAALLDHNNMVTDCNELLLDLAGAANSDVTGRSFLDLIATENEPNVTSLLAPPAALAFGRSPHQGLAATLIKPNGATAPIALFATSKKALSSEEEKHAVIVLLQDRSEQSAVEHGLRDAREAADKRDTDKTQFLARISHELRTPLNAILGFSEIMRDEQLGPMQNAKYARYAADIHHSGALLLNLVNQLLDLSKVESGQMRLDFESVPLRPLIDQCVRLLGPAADKKQIRMRIEMSDRTPPVVADQQSIEQIVLNLLANAIKFSDPGAEITISLRLSAQGSVNLKIADNGAGMTEVQLAEAMEPYGRVGNGRKGGAEGTGLGLPLAKALAEANKAEFQIASEPAAGTSIEIVFPSTQVLAD